MKKYIVVLLLVVFVAGCGARNEVVTSSEVIGCNGCVYSRFSEKKKIGDRLDDYYEDYTKINNSVFLGHVLNNNNEIVKGFICGTHNDKIFCLEGNVDSSKYEANKKILNEVFGENHCGEEFLDGGSYYDCDGVSISDNGTNYVGPSKSNQCYALVDGSTYCYGE